MGERSRRFSSCKGKAKKLEQIYFQATPGIQGFEKFKDEWEVLASCLGDDCVFHHLPDWYLAALYSGTIDPATAWLVTAHMGGKLVAVLPLQFQDYKIGVFRPRLLGTMEHDQLQSSDFLIDPRFGTPEFIGQVVAWLATDSGLSWDGFRLRKIPEHSLVRLASVEQLPAGSTVLRHDASAYFDVTVVSEKSLCDIPKEMRRNLVRQIRRADECFTVRYESTRTMEGLVPAFEAFLKVEASGWKGRTGLNTAIVCQPSIKGFFQELMTRFGKTERCVINTVWFDDEPVAAQFALKLGRTLHILKVGYDESKAKFAPGNTLLYRVLEEACADASLDRVSLVNNPPWAQRFHPRTFGAWSYYIPNNTLRGRMVLGGLTLKRALDRRKAKSEAPCSSAEVEREAPVAG
jgi:CelD/BcsL family acetyltransferase involved in cellulose biosynthesis